MNLSKSVEQYIQIGYKKDDAISKVAQDIILLKISKSNFSEYITIKGGVVMHSISRDNRRATRDLDMDFIKYSLEDNSIHNFILKLNAVKDGISIEIVGKIEKLHHQDYDGKRVNIRLIDSNEFIINTKLDIGVHKLFDIEQDNYCFDLGIFKENVNLLINSREQIFAEKLKSLLKFGITSTRYKDVFDFYYLINNEKLDKNKLLKYIDILIFEDSLMKENDFEGIITRINLIFKNSRYRSMLNQANNNWLNLPVDIVINNILEFLSSLEVVSVWYE